MNPRRVPRFFWLLLLTLLIAAFLRLWQLDTLPPGLHYDEAADTIIAQQIARGESAPIFVAAYGQGSSFLLLGGGLDEIDRPVGVCHAPGRGHVGRVDGGRHLLGGA